MVFFLLQTSLSAKNFYITEQMQLNCECKVCSSHDYHKYICMYTLPLLSLYPPSLDYEVNIRSIMRVLKLYSFGNRNKLMGVICLIDLLLLG